MRKSISLILTILILISSTGLTSFAEEDLLVRVPEITPLGVDAGTELNGYVKGIELLKNSYYNDLSKSSYEEDVTRMSALDVINKSGSDKYNPEDKLTGFGALELLVTLAGNSNAVQTRALAASKGMDADGVRRVFNQQYQAEAITLGIVLANEVKDYNTPIDRQTFALWVSRVSGVGAPAGNLNNVYSYKDFGTVSPDLRPIVEGLVQSGIMSAGNDGNFNPKGNLTKGEAASVANKASTVMANQLGITSSFGVVASVVNNSTKSGNATISTKKITVRNVDGTTSTINTSYNDKTRQKTDFVALRNGIVSDSSILKIGDQIEYVSKNNEVRYVKVNDAEDFSMQISDTIINQEGLKKYFGTIGTISNEKQWDKGKYINRDRFRIKNYDGQSLDLLVTTNLDTGVKNDATVLKNGVLGGANLLKAGDNVEYLLKGNKLVYMVVKDLTNKTVLGTVRHVYQDPDTKEVTLTIFDYNNQILEYPVSHNVSVMINQNYGNIMDLQYAQDIKINILNGYVTSVESESFAGTPGYIPKFGKVRFGEVLYLYPDSAVIQLATGETLHFEVDRDVPIIRGGEVVTFRTLKEGDKLKVYFDDISTIKASAIEVDAVERLVKQIYKGEVVDVNEFSKNITINNLEYLKNSNWDRDSMFIRDFKVSDDVEIYLKGKRISLSDLSKVYKNTYVYAVIEDSYGKDMIVKMNLKEGGERFYYDKINSIDKAIGELELRDKTNFRFDDGTIVVKDSRVLSSNKLTSKSDVFVVSGFNTYYDNYANVIKVQSKGDTVFSNIYIGAIEQVHGAYFNMADYTTVSDNIWETVKTTNSQNFYFNNQSVILDQTKDKYIKYYNLFNGKYSRSDNFVTTTGNKGLQYKRYYGVVVTDDSGQVLQLNLRQKGLLPNQNFDDVLKSEDDVSKEVEKIVAATVLTRGIIDEVQSDWNRVKLTDAHDWIETRGMWVANPTDKYVEYENAIIIKDNKAATYEDLEAGDSLFIVRTKEKGLVIVVE